MCVCLRTQVAVAVAAVLRTHVAVVCVYVCVCLRIQVAVLCVFV